MSGNATTPRPASAPGTWMMMILISWMLNVQLRGDSATVLILLQLWPCSCSWPQLQNYVHVAPIDANVAFTVAIAIATCTFVAIVLNTSGATIWQMFVCQQ